MLGDSCCSWTSEHETYEIYLRRGHFGQKNKLQLFSSKVVRRRRIGPTDSVWRALGPCRRTGHTATSMRGWMAARSSSLFKRRSRRRAVWNTFLEHTRSHCDKMATLNLASVSKHHFPKLNLPPKLQPIHSPVDISRICRAFSNETWQL